VTLRIFNQGANDLLAKLIVRFDEQGAEIGLDQLLILDALRSQDFIDVTGAADILQLSRDEARRILDGMCLPPLHVLERRGHTAAATFHLAKGIAKELKGKAAYTKARGLNPVRYAELAREYLRDHQRISNEELRQLLGLGDSPSAKVEASRYLKKWSQPDGFLERKGGGSRVYYTSRSIV
jgi:ATP-dependent DNA helicase RecG